MKPRLNVVYVLLLVAVSASAQSKTDQSTDRAQVVSTAEITKIDAKKMTIQVRELVQPTSSGRRGGANGGRGGGRQRRGGGIGFPGGGRTGGGGGSRYPGGNDGSSGTRTAQTKEYKVFVTKDTVMKLADTNIEFGDLHVDDRVIISGFPKGTKGDVEAATITRIFQ